MDEEAIATRPAMISTPISQIAMSPVMAISMGADPRSGAAKTRRSRVISSRAIMVCPVW
jgi:hypothetical protein